MTDIITRLRALDEKGYQPLTGAIGNEAAEEIIRLRSFVNSLVSRRADGTIVVCRDEFAQHAHKYLELISAPAICLNCGTRHTAPTTGQIMSRCALCGGVLVPET